MSYTVLIVDDSSTIRSMIRRSIGMSGLDIGQIYEAGNGIEALNVLETEWIDIVFTDLNMPEMDGVELVQQMSEDNVMVTIPVVVVSSDRSQARIDALKKSGIRAYLKKPARPETFREVVEKILGERS